MACQVFQESGFFAKECEILLLMKLKIWPLKATINDNISWRLIPELQKFEMLVVENVSFYCF